jgi:hypothetical protein
MKKVLILFAILTAGFFFMDPVEVSAASLNLAANKVNISIGDTVRVDIHVNSEGSGVNAFQATLNFPKDILQTQSIDKTDSIVNFWLQDPTFSNDTGQIKFIGGSTSGLFGQSLQIATVVFKATGSGQANLVFSDGAVTASDGSGTNVLSVMNGLQMSVIPKTGVVVPGAATAAVPMSQIVREAVPAAAVPARPILEIPLYPNPVNWYNLVSNFLVQWTLPLDITGVATAVDKSPTTVPTVSEGLFNNKNFNVLPDGVSHLHVRFKNNIGWGSTTHYRLAIDTKPPLPFEITITPAFSTMDPNPTISYETADQLSGLNNYTVQIDNVAATATDETTFAFVKLSPGKHTVTVAAIDKAGNKTIKTTEIDILPLPSPTITSVSREVFVGEGGLKFQGVSLPDFSVNVVLRSGAGDFIDSVLARPDQNGNFSGEINNSLRKGNYYLEFIAENNQGAVSLTIKSAEIKAKERPVMSFGGLEITQSGVVVILALTLFLGIALGWLLLKEQKIMRGHRTLIAQRDIVAVFGLINKDVNKMMDNYGDNEIDKREASEIQFILKRIQSNMNKLSKYLIENVGEINK